MNIPSILSRIPDSKAFYTVDEMAARGRERVRSFTWQACAEKTAQVYESVL